MSTEMQIDPNGDGAFYDRLLGRKRVNQRANFTAEALRGETRSMYYPDSGPLSSEWTSRVPLICGRHNQRITHC